MTNQVKGHTRSKLVHIAEKLSLSKYVNQKIVVTLPFKSANGVVSLWINENGTVIGLDYYKEVVEDE